MLVPGPLAGKCPTVIRSCLFQTFSACFRPNVPPSRAIRLRLLGLLVLLADFLERHG